MQKLIEDNETTLDHLPLVIKKHIASLLGIIPGIAYSNSYIIFTLMHHRILIKERVNAIF